MRAVPKSGAALLFLIVDCYLLIEKLLTVICDL